MHADLRARAAIATPDLPWRGSEKLLEDAGPRRTRIVRAPAGARLACTDAFVLDNGTYARGELVTDAACTVFVKQRPSLDDTPRSVDARSLEFLPHHTPGLAYAPLYEDDTGRVVLLSFAPGTYIGPHVHDAGEEFFVIDGEATDEHGTYRRHAWVRQPVGSRHSIRSVTGCLFLTFADHLG